MTADAFPGVRSSFVAEYPNALIAVKQLEYAQLWLSTYNVVAVRKAIEDQAQAVISGKKQADEAVRDAQKNADEILRPYNEKIAHVSGL